MSLCLSKLIECTTWKPNINYGLWLVMICQCRFISCNKCTTLVADVDSEGGCAFVTQQGQLGIWELSTFHSVLL